MFKTKNKSHSDEKIGFVRIVHLQTVAVLVGYFILSNMVFVSSIAHSNFYVSFFVPLTFGTLSSFVFLYLFNHKDFFHFMGGIETDEKDKEKKYLDKFNKYGRIAASVLVAAFGGPIFLALTVRLLFFEPENRYWIAFVSTLISTIVMVGFAKGLFNFIFPI